MSHDKVTSRIPYDVASTLRLLGLAPEVIEGEVRSETEGSEELHEGGEDENNCQSGISEVFAGLCSRLPIRWVFVE